MSVKGCKWGILPAVIAGMVVMVKDSKVGIMVSEESSHVTIVVLSTTKRPCMMGEMKVAVSGKF